MGASPVTYGRAKVAKRSARGRKSPYSTEADVARRLLEIGRVAGEAHAMAMPRPTLWGRLRWLLTGR